MDNQQPGKFKPGDRVKILHSNIVGRVVAQCGPLGPKGAQIYGVRWGSKPNRPYIEVREDQLEVILPEP